MKQTIIIAPNAGFCNRLRAMVSAIYLSEKLDMNIEHLWIGTPYRCANGNIQEIHDKSFNYYFEENIKSCDYKNVINNINKVYTEWMPTGIQSEWYIFQSYGQKLLQISNFLDLNLIGENMDTTESFLIETSYLNNLKITREDKTRIYKKYFIPRDIFLNETNINENLIGISIRKGDFKIYFPETQMDDEIIMKWINKINNKIFFCSDDKVYEKNMRNQIKNSFKPIYNRNDDNDFIDFILLSKCIKIYGTQKSSFSEEASHFGSVEYIPLTQEFFFLNNC
jgi:hypothetical protein